MTLYVTQPTDLSDSRSRYLHDSRPTGLIVAAPQIGDQVIDILDVHPAGERTYSVHSRALCKEIRLESTWLWGDQYEVGAEYDLAQECLAVLHGKESFPMEHGPLHPLVYPAAPAATTD